MNHRNHQDEEAGRHRGEPGGGRDQRSSRDAELQADEERRESLSLAQVVASTLAAVVGVQSSRNRARDFTHGKASHFIAAGIVFTVLFVLGLVLVVNLVLSG